MKRILTSVVSTVLLANTLLAQQVTNAKPILICQGEYSTLGKDAKGDPKVLRLDRWHMDSIADGSYSVVVELVSPVGVKAEERHALTKELKPKAYVLVLSKGASSDEHSMKIECDYGMTELGCRTTNNGTSVSETIRQEPPYLFWPIADVSPVDFPWEFQALISQAERVIGHNTSIPLITLDDSEGALSLKIQEIHQVEYLGQEKVEVVGQQVLARTFRVVGPNNEEIAQKLWVSESGIVLSMKLGEGVVISLTHYQGPSLSP